MLIADTDVLVDILRKHPPALDWLGSLTQYPYVTGYSVLEVYAGCRNSEESRKAKTFLSSFPIVWLSADGCDKALDCYPRHHLACGLGVIDALVAQIALDTNAILATFNTKHFNSIEGLSVAQPYPR